MQAGHRQTAAPSQAESTALLAALRPLDELLITALDGLPHVDPADPYRALYLTAAAVAQQLRAEDPVSMVALDRFALPPHTRLATLAARCALDALDIGLLLCALAAELDRRYERVFGCLHDDMTRRRPTVGLALQLLCPGRVAQLSAYARFATAAPLLRHQLVQLLDDPQDIQPPLSLKYLRADPRVVAYLLGDDAPDERLHEYAELTTPQRALDELVLTAPLAAQLDALAAQPPPGLVCYLYGSYGSGRQTVAGALGRAFGHQRVLTVAAARLPAAEPGYRSALSLLVREAALQNALLVIELADEPAERGARQHALLAALTSAAPAVISGTHVWEPIDPPPGLACVRLELPRPAIAERTRLWAALGGGAASPADYAELAAGFQLTAGEIRDACATAAGAARLRGATPTVADLRAACQLHSSPRLGALARQIQPRFGWNDLVLPADRVEQLRDLCAQVQHRATVHERWGFGAQLALGGGLCALFSGASGTGKTMAAEVIAGALGRDLYRIDLALVVSKYIGETEKNLGRIFDAAEQSSAILFFDEADALFGKRSEVQDAHDRYANIEVGYLLQRLEAYSGLAILATNLRKNMDEAFVRRIQFIVEFPLPAVPERQRIWQQVWPAALPRDPALNMATLAQRWPIAGGSIRNVALAAAFLAAADGGVVRTEHLVRAARREYQKIGKVAGDHEFGGL